MTGKHILVVDDEPDIREVVKDILEDEGYEVSTAANAAEARERRRQRKPDLILLDIWMPDLDGISLLKEWKEAGGLPCPVVIMSGHGTVETAVEATRLGAYDFIEKPLTTAKLLLTVKRALEAEQLARENLGLRQQAVIVSEPVGSSPVMQALRDQARRVAQHDTWVLITGEPGSGKETLARYIHSLSARREGPFVAVNAVMLSREDAAVELFGSEEGETIHYGLLEQANGGTLFLDEVTDMDMQAQGRLLSALEGERFTRVGGREPVEVDVRVIAATQADLRAEVEAGRFRDELFHRLNVVPLHVPPLREHAEDVPELLAFYVDYYNTHEGLPYRHFSIAAQNRLLHYHWPGNVLELRNLVQRLLILGTEEEITAEEVEGALAPAPPSGAQPPPPPGTESWFELPMREAREAFERAYLQHHLQKAQGSVTRLSEQVGMERTHLYRKLRSLGINPKDMQ
ncbi:MAG TPA: sigma-54-dependent Fis family transcriptional regulator [Chromatiales bacterium]|nr:sigma-54-dependent Fis family transcriptional regulator [Chromatiales bacterium]